VVVGDDEDALADPRPARSRSEVLVPRKRVPALPFDREIGELGAEERRARDMRVQIEIAPRLPLVERVRAVDEPVDQ
jgi:hypothetical protein